MSALLQCRLATGVARCGHGTRLPAIGLGRCRWMTDTADQSRGVRRVDHTGRRLLDLSSSAANAPIGHNHPMLDELLKPGASLTQVDAKHIMERLAPKPDDCFEWSLFNGDGIDSGFKLASKLKTKRDRSQNATEYEILHASEFLNTTGDESGSLEKIHAVLGRGRVSLVVADPVPSNGAISATDSFFRSLRSLAGESNTTFLVDETESGMATGRVWAHERWGLETPADMVLFGKRLQQQGLYAQKSSFFFASTMSGERDHCPNLWLTDPLRLCKLATVKNIVESEGLFERSMNVGQKIFDSISVLAAKHPGLISKPRGRGSLLAFDSGDDSSALVEQLLIGGILVGKLGRNTVSLTPSLIFDQEHADEFISALELACSNLAR